MLKGSRGYGICVETGWMGRILSSILSEDSCMELANLSLHT